MDYSFKYALKCKMQQIVREIALILLFLIGVAQSYTLWFERGVNFDDPCTIVFHSIPMQKIIEYHPNPECKKAGVFWGATSGRVRMHFEFPDHRSFNVCITAGEFDTVYLWYDYVEQYWTPMPLPSVHSYRRLEETCKRSVNGSLDMYMEPPWAKVHYYGHYTYEVVETPGVDDVVVLRNPYRHPDSYLDDEDDDDDDEDEDE